MDNVIFITRLKQTMKEQKMTQGALAAKSGIRQSSISDYLRGKYIPKLDKIQALAGALSVSPEWLSGDSENHGQQTFPEFRKAANCVPLRKRIYNLITERKSRNAKTSEKQLRMSLPIDFDLDADFVLTMKDDSMQNIHIKKGDLVFIKTGDKIKNGSLTAVMIDGTAILRRYYNLSGIIQLTAENPLYAPLAFNPESAKNITVLGIAVGVFNRLSI